MIVLGFVLLIVILASLGYGKLLKSFFPNLAKDYALPLGFAMLLALVQIFYYPAMLVNLNSSYEHICTLLILFVGIIILIYKYKLTFNILDYRHYLLFLALIVFVYVYYHSNLQLAFSDSQMYLNYMSQNVNIKHLNLFHLWTGQTGKEWDSIYLFQGYYHFGSFITWFTNYLLELFKQKELAYITIQTWGLGLLYSLVSSCALLNFVSYLVKEKKKYILLAILALFYFNFYYWRVALAFYGNTFRSLWIAYLWYLLARYFKENNHKYKYLMLIISFAGLACSSSYLFISFALFYALMVYLFKWQGVGTIKEMADIVLPLVVYILALLSRANLTLCIILLLVVLFYYLSRNNLLLPFTTKIEKILSIHSQIIFIYGMTLLLIVGGAIYYFLINRGYEYNYVHYFANHQTYDMIKDYFFIYSGKTQFILNALRWLGVLLFIKKEKKNNFFNFLLFVALIIFLNPLNTVAIAKLFASNVYYRTFEVIFNPFSELVFALMVIDLFKKYRLGNYLLYGGLIYLLIYTHIFSFLNPYSGEYGAYVHEDILPKYKMDNDSYQALINFKTYLKDKHYQRQIRVISHVEGLRTFLPQANQVFTLREYYYPNERLNVEFYEQARNHYSYGSYLETDFSTSCQYSKRFKIDYFLIDYLNNPDFDIEISKCSKLIYQNVRFRIYEYQ